MEGSDSTNSDYSFIIDSKLRNQNNKLDTVIILIIIIFIVLLSAWMINIYVKVDEINIYDCNNDLEVDGIDINYLIEQNRLNNIYRHQLMVCHLMVHLK